MVVAGAEDDEDLVDVGITPWGFTTKLPPRDVISSGDSLFIAARTWARKFSRPEAVMILSPVFYVTKETSLNTL